MKKDVYKWLLQRRRGSVFVRLPSQSQSNSTRPASDDDTDADTADAAAAAANADAALISEMHACRDQLSQLLAAVLQLQVKILLIAAANFAVQARRQRRVRGKFPGPREVWEPRRRSKIESTLKCAI